MTDNDWSNGAFHPFPITKCSRVCQDRAYSGFRRIKWQRVFSLHPGREASPRWGYLQHIFTEVERGNEREKCFAQEYNTLILARDPFLESPETFRATKLFCYNLHLKRERHIRWILLLPSFRKCSLIFWSVSLYTPRRGSFPFTTKITACAYLANVRARFAAASDFCLSPGFWS